MRFVVLSLLVALAVAERRYAILGLTGPAAGAPGYGAAVVDVPATGSSFVYSLFAETAGTNITAAHIHVGTLPASGAVAVNLHPQLTGVGSSRVSGFRVTSVAVDAASADAVRTAGYVAVHTGAFPSGHLVGNLETSTASRVFRFGCIAGIAAPTYTATSHTGFGVIRVDTAGPTYSVALFFTQTAGVTQGHLHLPSRLPTSSSPQLFFSRFSTLGGFTTGDNSTIAPASATAVSASNAYFAVHTTDAPAGAIAGNLALEADALCIPTGEPATTTTGGDTTTDSDATTATFSALLVVVGAIAAMML